MAQEPEKVFPDMVSMIEPGKKESLPGINYSNFGVIAIKAFQEQQQLSMGKINGSLNRKPLEKLLT